MKLRPINYGSPVNWAHPLNHGLTLWGLPLPNWSGGSKVFDLCGRNRGTLTNSPAWGRSQLGFGSLTFTAASFQYVDFGTPTGLNSATAAAYSCSIYKPSNAVTVGLGASGGSSTVGGDRFSFIWWTDGVVYVSAEDVSSAYGSFTLTPGSPVRLLVAYDGSQSTNATRLQVWANGSPQTLTFTGTIPANLGSSVGPFTWGRDGNNRATSGTVYDSKLWVGKTGFNDAYAKADYYEWLLGFPDTLQRIRSRTWSFENVGAYTLAIDAGSYSVTGSAVGLKASRQLAEAAGSYTQTGQAVGLKAGRQLASASGSYTLTGQDVGLKAGRQLASAAGSYSLTGSDVALKAGRQLAVASGAYTLTGQDVTLTYSGASGAYTLASDAGSYALTGSAVGLKADRQLAVGSGSYTLSGQAVALPTGHALPMGVGSYLTTGAAVALRAARMIAELSGTYTLTGQDVTFTYTPAAVDLLDGLEAHYRLDGDLTDSSGNGRDLTGSGTYQSGLLGQELATGSGTRTPLGGLDGSALSLSAWLTVPSSIDEGAGFVGFGSATETVQIRADNAAVTFVVDGSIEHSQSVTQNDRHHVALTYDGATARLYVDGSLVMTGGYTFSPGWETDDFSINTAYADTSAIDNVSVYSRAINAAEVDDLYNGGTGYDPSNVGPVARWTVAGVYRGWGTVAGVYRGWSTVAGTLQN